MIECGAERVMAALSGEDHLADVVAELEQRQHYRAVANAAVEALLNGNSAAAVREACEAGIRRYQLAGA